MCTRMLWHAHYHVASEVSILTGRLKCFTGCTWLQDTLLQFCIIKRPLSRPCRSNFGSSKIRFQSKSLILPFYIAPPHSLRFLDQTQGHITVGRTPLDEGSALRKDLYLTTHNIQKKQTSMPAAGFEHAIAVSKRPQTLAWDRSATGFGHNPEFQSKFLIRVGLQDSVAAALVTWTSNWPNAVTCLSPIWWCR